MSCVCPAAQQTRKVVSISSGKRYGAPDAPLRAFRLDAAICEAFAAYRKLRQVAEHRLARLMQLGVRQARYFGRTKTLCQLPLAATVANLTLVATRVGLMRD